jgi:hypothetical protein
MTTDIKSWEIVDGRLVPVESRLADYGRRGTRPRIVAGKRSFHHSTGAQDYRSASSHSVGSAGLLAIDRTGGVVVIELKRDRLPRDALAQAIDYAADIATWSLEKLGEVCANYCGEALEDVLSNAFPDIDLETLTINGAQRIALVGFALEPALERMIEWLSGAYGVAINAVVLKYVRAANGAEILSRSAVISEEEEEARTAGRKFKIPMSDEPGVYPEDQLRGLLVEYLSRNLVTIGWIRDLLLPECLKQPTVTRDELKDLVARTESADARTAGLALGSLSSQLGRKENDFLRQVLGYGYPNHPWEKDGFFIRPERRELVAQVLEGVRADRSPPMGLTDVPASEPD